jgi:hypothetical protein
MTRTEFTKQINILINKMFADGHLPIMDFCMRSKFEQKRLFDLGYSKCDGTIKISRHQLGLALDIYFVVDGQIDFGYNTNLAKQLSAQYHAMWMSMGGKPPIDWDKPHFEA